MNASYPGRRRSGFTLLEVVVALAIFLMLAVPLAWMTVWTAQGKAWARELDDAVALGREEWGTVRRIRPKLLRDTVREAKVGERAYRVVRTVTDTVPNGIVSAAPEVGRKSASPKRPGVRVCVVRPGMFLPRGDTVRCFSWRVPLVEVQP